MGEGRGGRRVGQVVCGHVDGLHGRDGALARRGDPLLEHAHLGGQGRLVTDGGRDTTEKRGHLGTGPGEAEDVGISIIDVRIRRADRLPEVNASIFNEMRLAREQEAERIRAEGDEIAAKIKAEADRERTVLLAKAREESQIIRGNGDAKRNEIYNAAYGQDLNFFNFYRGLEACEESSPAGSRVVISPDKLNICEDILASARQSVPARR